VVPALRAAPGLVVIPRIGLRFPRQLPFEAWLGIGSQLSAAAASSAWCLGDWLAYGQQAYGGRYRDALEQTGLDYQTLRNYAWVARQFPVSRRRDTLSFGHHAEVAARPEPEQVFWLRKAEQFGWSTSQLRRQVRASLAERGNGQPHELPGPDSTGSCQRASGRVTVRVQLTPEQAQRCEQAAQRDGLAVPTWAAQILDQAAHDNRSRPSRPCHPGPPGISEPEANCQPASV
jgi:hypothetical protein